ncbi:hypothetical protein JW905_01460, partial [bacterium]|nr:hypothetical protein [candidate division CSSED10-310 bacterium]
MQKLLAQISRKTDAAEVFGLDTSVNLVIYESGRLKNLNTLNSTGAAVRAMVDGKLGQAIISDMRDPAQVADRIRALAELGDRAHFSFSGPAELKDLNLVDERVAGMTVADIVDAGREAVELIQAYDAHIGVDFIGERSLDKVQVMTTAGASTAFER